MALHLSWWVLPIISGIIWLSMLLGLLLHWIVNDHRRHYPEMKPNLDIAYISNVGAHSLKPLFIAGCVLTCLTLDASFAADHWLRHRGRLVPNISLGEKVLKALAIVFALVGSAGLILLSIFDVRRHKKLHDIFLLMFMAGYLLSAIFICWEYQRLGIKNREHPVLRKSFWIKLVFIVAAFALSVGFAAMIYTKHYNTAAVLEWVIAFIFTFYIFSFYVDLWPAVYTRPKNARNWGKAAGGLGHNPRQMEEASDEIPPRHVLPASSLSQMPNQNF